MALMIGRGAIGNPWIFRQIKHYFETGMHLPDPGIQERVEVCRQHLEMSVRWKGELIALREMRRHYTAYFKGIPNFKPLRIKLVTSDDLNEVRDTLELIKERFASPPDRAKQHRIR